MNEKLNADGRIISAEDAHELADLENKARDAEGFAALVSEAAMDLEDPSEDALNYEVLVHDNADDARRLADTALKSYNLDSQEDKTA